VNCPACKHEMTAVKNHDIVVDVCESGCGGIWFDWFELKKVDEPHEALGENLMHVRRNEALNVDLECKRDCPQCDGVTMLRHFASVKREVQVDECPSCAGFFLDYGELHQIREQYETAEERSRAAESLFTELFDGSLDEKRSESEDRLGRAKALARMFRFLLPSYYIPGKQKWGAF